MTPKEMKLVKELVEKAVEEGYRRGFKDATEGRKPLEEKDFSMGKGSALILSTTIKKFLENR